MVLDLEADLLRDRGHRVERFVVSNTDLPEATLRTGLETVWSHRSYRRLRRELRKRKPDLAHVHNTFPRLSPSVYWAMAAEGVPVVQTLHNYRLTCANALLMRDGRPCEECVGRFPLPALRYRTYRDSLAATGAVVAMQVAHRKLGTYKNKVDAYIALTEFARSLMVRSGLPEERVHVKPNFIPDPLPAMGSLPERKRQIIFVGRVAHEKGVDLLLEAWNRLKPSARLVIVGDGPEQIRLRREYRNLPGVEWHGWLEREQVLREIAASRYLAMPSRWYETLGMVLIEALSLGTPVVVPGHAGFPEIITPGRTGMLFSPGDGGDLARVIDRALRFDDTEWQRWSDDARRLFLSRYSEEANYRRLVTIYEKAIEHARK